MLLPTEKDATRQDYNDFIRTPWHSHLAKTARWKSRKAPIEKLQWSSRRESRGGWKIPLSSTKKWQRHGMTISRTFTMQPFQHDESTKSPHPKTIPTFGWQEKILRKSSWIKEQQFVDLEEPCCCVSLESAIREKDQNKEWWKRETSHSCHEL